MLATAAVLFANEFIGRAFVAINCGIVAFVVAPFETEAKLAFTVLDAEEVVDEGEPFDLIVGMTPVATLIGLFVITFDDVLEVALFTVTAVVVNVAVVAAVVFDERTISLNDILN